MEFIKPETLQTREQCARAFCSVIQRLLTFLAKNIVERESNATIEEIRIKFRQIYDTLFSCEQITEHVGGALLAWAPQITAYNAEFFEKTDLMALIRDAGASSAAGITSDKRERFFRAMNARTRTVTMDALNNLLILYARYEMMRIH